MGRVLEREARIDQRVGYGEFFLVGLVLSEREVGRFFFSFELSGSCNDDEGMKFNEMRKNANRMK